MDYLSLIKQPIQSDLNDFNKMFDESLMHADGMLSQALDHIRRRTGKRMRPILVLLMARNYGNINMSTLHAAVGLELLHTASLVHDDVVDESVERRGQASVNATYNNKVAVLVGDYLLSTALLHVAYTGNQTIVEYLAKLGRTLASGEILQLSNISNQEISEEIYYEVIKQKTSALFEACCSIGALSSGASEEDIEKAKRFGQNLGIMFQIRDDIFDYYPSSDIGKPTGNDMAEGKLTLPVIYALKKTNNDDMYAIARKVKTGLVSQNEINRLVEFTKQSGGIEYAEQRMEDFRNECMQYIDANCCNDEIRASLTGYVSFVIQRKI